MIRKLTATDIDKVLNIWLEASFKAHAFIDKHYWLSNVDNMHRLCLLHTTTFVYQGDEPGAEVTGFISLMDDGFIPALFVSPAVQQKGVGKALLNKARSVSGALYLYAYTENHHAVIFYQKQGFRVVDQRIEKETGHRKLMMSYVAEDNQNLYIRSEQSGDIQDIYNINLHAFGTDAEARLVNLLREGNSFIPPLSLVALLDGQIVGHILFTRVTIKESGSERTHESLALAPMAVLPDFQRKDIGKQLVWCGIVEATYLEYQSVIVLGHKDYYPRFGFEAAKKWGITSPYNVPDDVFMAMELAKTGLANVSGIVEYPKEFDVVS